METQKPAAKASKSILVAFDWYDHRVYRGIAQYCAEHNWHLSPYLFSDRTVPTKWKGDGAITCYGETLGDFILSLDMPKVDITRNVLPTPIPRVTVDNDQIGRRAARHFLERGYRNFAYYSWESVAINQVRKDAFIETLKAADVPEEGIHIINQPSIDVMRDWEMHVQSMVDQIKDLPRPLAVFTGQDNLGVTLVEVCTNAGISVPDEIAVLGVDNIDFLCECAVVPLSSIDSNLTELGYAAAEQLGRLMDGEIDNEAEPVTVPIKSIVNRRSTEALAVTHPAVAKALELMRREFKNGLVLEDVYEYSGVSKRGLEKAFKRHLNDSPAAVLRRIRLDYAKNCLSQTDIKIDAIAMECGYSNSSNLSHAFNREIGMSPQEYRNVYRSPLFKDKG
ncbi:xylose operon transcription regulator XylR [Rubritalea tangerina]|uniref:Substrate-binding domain-containing protein n=1 Tax=Rubritalea tangerina TaxID=430798 RepID=A0ABW4ZCL6_9BACT